MKNGIFAIYDHLNHLTNRSLMKPISKKMSEEFLLLFKAQVDLTDNHVFLVSMTSILYRHEYHHDIITSSGKLWPIVFQFQKWPATDITKYSPLLSDQTPATISTRNLSLMTSAKVNPRFSSIGYIKSIMTRDQKLSTECIFDSEIKLKIQ